jgi:hypothetical protein
MIVNVYSKVFIDLLFKLYIYTHERFHFIEYSFIAIIASKTASFIDLSTRYLSQLDIIEIRCEFLHNNI